MTTTKTAQARDNLQAALQDLVLLHPDIDGFLEALAVTAADWLDVRPGTVLLGVSIHDQGTVPIVAGAGSSPIDPAALYTRAPSDGEPTDDPALATSSVVDTLEDQATLPRTSLRALAGFSVRSIVSVSSGLGSGSRATFSLYSTEPSTFTPEQIAGLERFARSARRSLILALCLARSADRVVKPQSLMRERTMIDLAVGTLVASTRCSAEEAMRSMLTTAIAQKLPVSDIAAEILDVSAISSTQTITTQFDA